MEYDLLMWNETNKFITSMAVKWITQLHEIVNDVLMKRIQYAINSLIGIKCAWDLV